MIGVHRDLSAAEYNAIPALRSTVLRALLRDGPAAAHALELGEASTSEAKEFGILLHACVLEPERFERDLVEIPHFRGRGATAMKAEWLVRNAGKVHVRPKWRDQLFAMRDAVHAHSVAGPMFAGPALNELSIVWQDPMGLLCKVRLDRVYRSVLTLGALDLKSTRNASESLFRYDVREYGYDVEAALYLRAIDVKSGEIHRPFHFVAVEKAPPYRVEVYELLRSERARGTAEMLRGMEMYAECVRTGVWDAKTKGVA